MKTLLLFALPFCAAFAQTPPVHPAWSGDQVHEIRVRFAQADYWEQMTANYAGPNGDTPYIEGSLEWGPYKFASVGVRFKGNSSYRNATTKKKPFRIKLNEYVKGQKIEGIGAFNLSNGWNDPSLVREPPYYELARELGLKAPRSNYAALYINDEYIGLYVLGEVINSDFLKNYFGKGEDTGNLYKANIGAVFAYLGEDKAAYKAVWEKQTNEEADDWADLIELCRIIDQTPAAELKAKLEPLMDIDSFLTAIALDNATVNLDSYAGMGQNFDIYRRPSDKRWVWLVWDPSLAFGAFSQGVTGQGAVELATEYVQTAGGFPGGGGNPGAAAGRPLATKLWAIPEYKERYRQIYKDMVERVFLPGKVLARMDALQAMIRPYVEADTQKLSTMEQFNASMTAPLASGPPRGGAAPGLRALIEGRTAWLQKEFNSQTFAAANVSASVNRLDFAMAAGGSAPAPQRVDVRYTGVNTPPTFAASAETQSGTWLTPSVTGGPLPGSFTVTVSGTGLAAGVHSGSITVHLGGAPAVVIPVTLTIGSLPVPAIAGVVNAASYSSGALAPGQLATIFGTDLGPAALSMSSGGVQVTFDGIEAQLLYVSAGQVGVIVPTGISGKTQTSVQLRYGNQSSVAVQKSVTATAPGLFTANSSGTGPGAIVNQTGTVNAATAPAAKGSAVSLYLTGAGLTNAQGAIAATVTVTIGGQSAPVTYAGVAPGSVQGLYQVNATIPAGTPTGPAAVVVTVGQTASQAGVTVNVQ